MDFSKSAIFSSIDVESSVHKTSPSFTISPTCTFMEVISDAAFDVTFVLLAPATVPLTEIVSDRSLFCTGSTSTVFTAIATCLVALCMDIPIQTTRTATITSTTISTFFFFFGFAAIAPAFCSFFCFLSFILVSPLPVFYKFMVIVSLSPLKKNGFK